MKFYLSYCSTPLGEMQILANKDGIYILEFCVEKTLNKSVEKILLEFKGELIPEKNEHIVSLIEELEQYFSGNLQIFKTPLVFSGSEFQNKVWKDLVNIPYAETRTYKDQAINYGDLKSIRAIASANGANKIAIVVPCHRVIGSDGSMTGYAGGIEKKKFLLNLERNIAGPADLFSNN